MMASSRLAILNTSPAGTGFNSQAVAVVEHEIDEVMGGGGPGSTIGDDYSGQVSGVVLGSTDLYRYQSSGSTCATVDSTPSYTTSSSAIACYSYDGGKTALVQMNQAGGNSDFGDFVTAPNIQDAFYPGTDPGLFSAFARIPDDGVDRVGSARAFLAGAVRGRDQRSGLAASQARRLTSG